jgi:hypothetical protein
MACERALSKLINAGRQASVAQFIPKFLEPSRPAVAKVLQRWFLPHLSTADLARIAGRVIDKLTQPGRTFGAKLIEAEFLGGKPLVCTFTGHGFYPFVRTGWP